MNEGRKNQKVFINGGNCGWYSYCDYMYSIPESFYRVPHKVHLSGYNDATNIETKYVLVLKKKIKIMIR